MAEQTHTPTLDEIRLEPEEEELTGEALVVRRWRFDQLAGLGFALEAAAALARDARVDLAQARRLVELGCPLPLAARILA